MFFWTTVFVFPQGQYGVFIGLNTFQLEGKTNKKCLDRVKLTTLGDKMKW